MGIQHLLDPPVGVQPIRPLLLSGKSTGHALRHRVLFSPVVQFACRFPERTH